MRAQCCICSDLFDNKYVHIAALPCGHTFHEDCLMRWMETSSTCPSCRSDVKRNQIIKRLFFDIREDTCEDEEVDKLLNQIKNLKVKLHQDEKVRDVLQGHIRRLRQENSALVEEMKEFRKTQKRLQELQNAETLLKGKTTGRISDIQDIASQYSEADESSVKQLASLLTVLKREYSQVERGNNEDQRKLVHLQNALRYSKTEGSQSFHKVLNEDSPNVASVIDMAHGSNGDEENGGRDHCLTSDLFEDSPKLHRNDLKRKCLEASHGPKLKFANVQTGTERFKSGKQSSSEILADDPLKIPQDMLNIMQKKLPGQSHSRSRMPSVWKYFMHMQGQSSAPLNLDSKEGVERQNSQMSSKLLSTLLAKEPQISSIVQSRHSLLP